MKDVVEGAYLKRRYRPDDIVTRMRNANLTGAGEPGGCAGSSRDRPQEQPPDPQDDKMDQE